MRVKWLRLLAVAAIMLGVLGACGDDDDDAGGGDDTTEETAEASEFSVKTTEYAFEFEGTTFEGGLVELTLDNSAGTEAHEADLVRLDDGKTLADFQAEYDPAAPLAPWAISSGGPGPVTPGKTAVYTANLEPGTYVVSCHIPAPDGREHLAHGMIAEVTVTEGEGEGDLPEADVTIGATEYEFTGFEDLEAGEQTVKVENQGEEQHFWAIAELAPGRTAQDLNAFFTSEGPPPAGPPPFGDFPGLVSTMGPGGEAVRTLDLEAGGTYALFCLIPAPDGEPHTNKGMLAEFTIS